MYEFFFEKSPDNPKCLKLDNFFLLNWDPNLVNDRGWRIWSYWNKPGVPQHLAIITVLIFPKHRSFKVLSFCPCRSIKGCDKESHRERKSIHPSFVRYLFSAIKESNAYKPKKRKETIRKAQETNGYWIHSAINSDGSKWSFFQVKRTCFFHTTTAQASYTSPTFCSDHIYCSYSPRPLSKVSKGN